MGSKLYRHIIVMGTKNLKGNFQMKNSDIFLISAKKHILISNLKYTLSMF